MSKIKQTELWIGGEHVPPSSGTYFDDLNPDDNSVYSRVAGGTAEDMDKAVKSAHAAFKANQHWLASDRERWLSKAAELVRAALGELEILPPSDARASLQRLTEFILRRKS